jgi:hypothetical protein
MTETTELDTPQVMNVKIVNRNDFVITDRFDGVPYVFEPNRPVSVPIDAANHIFGWYPGADPALVKRHVQKRFGWNTPAMESSGQNNRFFGNIEITPILYRMVPVEVDESGEAIEPTDSAKRAPKVNKMMAAADERAGARG